MENIPLYNSAILKPYMDLLEENYQNVEVNKLLEYAKIAPHEVDDRGHWFSQKQVNSFHEFLAKYTENPHIARDAGRFVVESKSSSLLRQYTAAFVSPSIAYWMLGKLSATLTKHVSIDVHYLATNKILVKATTKKDINEEPFQCENRIGLFEGLAKFFTGEYPLVEHHECIHKGDPCCRYIITWKITPGIVWKLIAGYTSILGIIASTILFFFSSFHSWMEYSLVVALMSISSLLISQTLTKKELNKSIKSQQGVAEQLLDQFNIRYNELTLIKEIGEAASSILDPNKLLTFITNSLQKRLQFSRGMIMFANQERTKLVYTVGYGYAPHEEVLLRNMDFHLTNPHSKGIFYLAYRDQKPFLITDVADIKGDLSEKSSNFAKELGIEAFICVPIIYEGKSEGILAVDNAKSKGKPTQSDLNLLMGIAPQIGISLNNALAHKKIKESEERFRNLSDNSPDIIYQLDQDGKFKYINPAWEEVLGHNKNELEDKYFADFVREEDRTEITDTFQKIITYKSTIRDKNFIVLNKKGLPRYVTLTGAPDLDAEEKVIGVVGTLKDITMLRSMEAQLLQASKMEAVGTLTGGIAHDFNNIIQAIMGYNQLMISGRADDETDMPYLKSIGELIQRSRELVKQLLIFSKKVEPLSKVININREIKSMHSLLTKSIPKMIEIQTHLNEDISPINADSTQIGQIIMNLVINARDAMGDSGNIIIKTNNLILSENSSINGLRIPAGNYAELAVSDTGCGMEKELMQHIFEPFFTTKEAGKGTGLGLAVVHGIVKNHGGFIYCESKPDEGTTFKILFPAATAVKPQQIFDKKSRKIPRGREKILVVDDEKNILETVRETLSLHGYKVVTTESAEQALEVYRAQKDKIKLVILDLNMPGKGGKKCLSDLLAINKRINVLMTSGYSGPQEIEEVTNAGAAGFINKPYHSEDLLRSIRKILDAPHQPNKGRIPLQSNKGV